MYSVYLVDDEPFVIESLRKIVNNMASEFKVVGWSYDAITAIEKVKKCKPDLLITDIKMPGVSGLELIEDIGREGLDLTIIVVSGFDDYDYVRKAFLLGAEDYILKPVVPAKFIALLKNIKIKLGNREEEQVLPYKKKHVSYPKKISDNELLLVSICDYLEQNLKGETSIAFICNKFSISQPFLSKLFKKYLNSTYNEYVTMIKIDMAKHLLSSRQDMLISTIADLTGYANQYYFSHVFKQIVGVSPSEFRSLNN